MKTDTRVAIAVVAAYFVLSAVLLPSSEYPRALGLGAVVFAAVAILAHRLGRGPIPGLSVLAVAFAAGTVLVMPTFPAMGGTTMRAVPIGFLGMQAAAQEWEIVVHLTLPGDHITIPGDHIRYIQLRRRREH